MFDIGVVGIVRGEARHGIIVAVKGSTSEGGKTKTFEEFVKKDKFFAGVMESNVFGVAGGVHGIFLLLGALGNNISAKLETVSTNGTTGIIAVGVIGISIAK